MKMSIRTKLLLFVLCAFLANILFVYGYYNLFLSSQITSFNTSMHEELQAETNRIAKEIDNREDFADVLHEIAAQNDFLIEVSDEDGATVLHAGKETEVHVKNSAAELFHLGDKVYLLKVTQMMQLKHISAYEIAWSIFTAEIIIIFIILLFSALPIYWGFAKPIISLYKNMAHYKEGSRPQRVVRDDEIGLLQNEFVTLTETIEKEKRKQHLIIASISHDIKTPLTSIMGFAERLKKPSLTPDRREQYVQIIYNKSISIKNLIEDFDEYLSLYIHSGLKQQRISVEKFCAILKADYEAELLDKDVDFSIQVSCPNESIFIDVSKMRRVFGNIIDNSLKHIKEQRPSIVISCFLQADVVRFVVDDNGSGIPEGELQKVFDPFYTSDKGRTVAGLGLSICKEIVEACGGKIWATNNHAGGASLNIDLPSSSL
jgi:signal transduction histidine kinase